MNLVHRYLTIFMLLISGGHLLAQGPFAPAANESGTRAIYKDSSIFVSWASSAEVHRGYQNILFPDNGRVSHGEWWHALGKTNPQSISLGDSGYVTVSYQGHVFNGSGPDFAVFENSFNHTFLELAFVEVSSDGVHFVRFPAESLTDTSRQVGSFDALEASNLYNLAGKYQGIYGTPFDLDDLQGMPGVNLDSITHIRVVDVVGSMNPDHVQRDSKGRPVNDPYPTDFEVSGIYTGGFDLNAVGLIHYDGEIFLPMETFTEEERDMELYPNPAHDQVFIRDAHPDLALTLIDLYGRRHRLKSDGRAWDTSGFPPGFYTVLIEDTQGWYSRKLYIR